MTYNDDYQQRQREDDRRRRDEEDSRRRDDEDRRRRNEDDRRRAEEDRRRRDEDDLKRRQEEARQAEIKKQAEEKAQARKEELERNAFQHKEDLRKNSDQHKEDLRKNSDQLKEDLRKNSDQLKKDLDARVEKEREWNKAMDRKIALKHAEVMSQQLSERRKQKENANYSSGATGILSDSISIAAAMRAMTGVGSDERSTFLDRNNVTRTLSDLSQSDVEIIYSEIKLQKQSNADEIVVNEFAKRASKEPLEAKAPKKPMQPSILDEKWNHDIKITSEESLQREKNVITKIPEFRWVTGRNRTISNLCVNDWKYPIKLSDDTIFGIGYTKKRNCQIIQKYYYKQLESVIEKQGTIYTLKDNVRVILKLCSGITESEIVDPVVAVQRIPITIDVITLLRHEDLINFNLKNKPSDVDITEDELKRLFDDGFIYRYTYDRCHTMERDTITQSQKTGEKLGRTVLEYIENLVDGKDWKHHWKKKYGQPPTQGEELRAMGTAAIMLTDKEINANERAEKEAYWKGLSLMEKVKHKFTNRP